MITLYWYTLIKIGLILLMYSSLLWKEAFKKGYETAYEQVTKTSN